MSNNQPVKIKQDINFLENPIWFQDEKIAQRREEGFLWQDKEGFLYRAGYKPPVKTDAIFLLYLLHISQQEGWKEEIKLTRYQVIKGCGLIPGVKWYDRLEDSLLRWKMVGIEFHGTFYDKKDYLTMVFGIIDDWVIDKKKKELTVRFSPKYLTKVRESSYFRFLDFNQIKALRSPLATRLYEILSKTFQNRDTWEIDAIKLAQKIPLNRAFASQVVMKVAPAVNRINKHTDLKIDLHVRQKSRGEIILTFTRRTSEEPAKNPVLTPTPAIEKPPEPHQQSLPLGIPVKEKPDWVKPVNPEYQSLIELLPRERRGQKSLQEALAKALNRYGSEYVAWNIRYANKHAKGNYPAYLLKALKNNYGQALREEDEIRQSVVQNRSESEKQKLVAQRQLQDQEARDTELAQVYLDSISSQERLKLEEEALTTFPPFLRARIEKANRTSVSFQAILRGMALDRIKERQAAAIEAPE